jgi:xanthine dehydrogenase accessory factor
VLASLGVDEEQRARVHSPAGLLLGGHTPAEVALSIMAELVQERASAGSSAAAGSASPAGSDSTESEAPVSVTLGQAPPSAAVPLAIDPVCGMSVVAVPASLHVDGDAGTSYFCSEGCRKAFLADPERYAVAS